MNPARTETERNPAIQAAVNERARPQVQSARLLNKSVDVLCNAVEMELGTSAKIAWSQNPIINGVTYTPEPTS